MLPCICRPNTQAGRWAVEAWINDRWTHVEQANQYSLDGTMKYSKREVLRENVTDITVRIFDVKTRLIAFEGPISNYTGLSPTKRENKHKVDELDNY